MILVTGGTGLVGSHLLWHLLQDHKSVRALYRKGSDLQRVQHIFSYYSADAATVFQKIQWVAADITDISALEVAFSGIDLVYHAAAKISFDPGDYKKLKKINAEGTANIVNICLANKVRKLCYVSTIGTIGKNLNGERATEENEWADIDANVYALTKYAAEMEVWRGSQEGLDVVIVNPGVILGPGFWNQGSGVFFTTANKGYSYYPPGGTGFVSIVDLVHIMIGLMDANIRNERFIVIAENLKFKEILSVMAEHLGRPLPSKPLHYWQLTLGVYADWLAHVFTGKTRKITKNTIKSLKCRDDYANDKVKKALEFEFGPLNSYVRYCCHKFREEHS